MKRFFIILVLAILGFFAIVQFKSCSFDETLFIQANEAYKNKDYDRALSLYSKEEIAIKPYKSAQLYYNKANSLFRLKRYPESLLYYLRAEKISPRDRDIRFNIDTTMDMLAKKRNRPGMLYNVITFLRFKEWILATLFFLWMAIFFVFAKGLRHTLKISLISFFIIMTLICTTGSLLYMHLVGINMGLTIKEVSLYAGPSLKETELGRIPPAEKLKVLHRQGNWLKVYFPAKKEVGWVESDGVPYI